MSLLNAAFRSIQLAVAGSLLPTDDNTVAPTEFVSRQREDTIGATFGEPLVDRFARLTVLRSNGGAVAVYNKFLIRALGITKRDRYSVNVGYGYPVLRVNGSDVTIASFSGEAMLNSLDGNQKEKMHELWTSTISANATLVHKQRNSDPWIIDITIRDMSVRGFLIEINQAMSAIKPLTAELAFTMFVAEP